MTSLREAVARALQDYEWQHPSTLSWEDEADAAISVARPIIEREVIERLIAELNDDTAEFNGLPLGWSEWVGHLKVEPWLRSHLPE